MEFYGRVVDQYGKPVPGVKAKMRYVYYNAVVLATYEPHKAEEFHLTDEKGEISFGGKEGVSLTVTLEPLKGLRFGRNGYWSYSFQSDKRAEVPLQPTSRDRPFIFNAYRLGEPAELIMGSMHELIETDRRVYSLGFDRKEIVYGDRGDIQISVWQTRGSSESRSSSWGVELTGNGTLLQETNDPFLFWAPDGGYAANWKYSWSGTDKDYSRSKVFSFWIKRGENFGSLKIGCDAFFKGEMMIEPIYRLNIRPNDPNLQPVLPDWPVKDSPARKSPLGAGD